MAKLNIATDFESVEFHDALRLGNVNLVRDMLASADLDSIRVVSGDEEFGEARFLTVRESFLWGVRLEGMTEDGAQRMREIARFLAEQGLRLFGKESRYVSNMDDADSEAAVAMEVAGLFMEEEDGGKVLQRLGLTASRCHELTQEGYDTGEAIAQLRANTARVAEAGVATRASRKPTL